MLSIIMFHQHVSNNTLEYILDVTDKRNVTYVELIDIKQIEILYDKL